MKNVRSRFLTVAMLVPLAALATACGSSSSASAGSTPSEANVTIELDWVA